jgi:hypothetical protein
MARKIRWRRVTCPKCGDRITSNALGRAAHLRHCTGRPRPESAEDAQTRRIFAGDAKSRDPS